MSHPLLRLHDGGNTKGVPGSGTQSTISPLSRRYFLDAARPKDRLPVASLLLLCAPFAFACSTIQPPRVTQFRLGVESARLQIATALAAVNAVATDDAIDRATNQDKLNEETVPIVLRASDIAAWDQAFANIDAYARSLEALLSPDVPKDFDDSVVALGKQLQELKQPVPQPVAAAFAELGRVLIELKAQHDAHKFAQQADPAVRNVFTGMGEGVPALRGTVRTHWDNQMDVKSVAFLRVPKGKARRVVVVGYVTLRDRRDAQDLCLEATRRSLLGLADAHSAMATGASVDLSSALATIKQELDETKSLYDRFKPDKQ